MKIIKLIVILGQLLFLFFINYYAFHLKNGDNQTSLDVLFYGTLFLIFKFQAQDLIRSIDSGSAVHVMANLF